MKAAIYARFSSSKQREASIDDQLRVCREWCDREGYEVVAEYADAAISGRTDARPEFQRMVANAGESDIVLVYMMDRFSRDPFDAPIYKRELAKKGVRLVSAMESIPDSPEGIIYEKLLEGLAACESRKTSVRTKRGMEGNALKCRTNGVRVFGYREAPDGTYEIDPEEAPFVVEAFRRRLEHETVNSIAHDFALRGVRTYVGNPCSHTMVHRMLANEKYCGVYQWGDVRREGGMPAIIDRATFEAAKMVRNAKNPLNETRGTFALSGRAVCAGCGRNMQGMSGRGRKNVKYEYYTCPAKCGVPNMRRDALEGAIADALRAMLADRDRTMEIARLVVDHADTEELEARRRAARKSRDDARRGIANLVKAMELGATDESVVKRLEELRAQEARAEVDLTAFDDEDVSAEDLADFLRCGRSLDDAALLDAFVWQAVVDKESAVVVLNYDAENGKPATLDVPLVRESCKWLPLRDSARISVCAVGRMILVRVNLRKCA